MKRSLTELSLTDFPTELRDIIGQSVVYDSSCSPEARVYFLDTGRGYYLKRAPKGSLKKEFLMDGYFHGLGLGARVESYISTDADYLLTERVPGEDCTHSEYLADGRRLAGLMGGLLRELHSLPHSDCPIQDRTSDYLAAVDEGYRIGRFDPSFLKHGVGSSADEAYKFVNDRRHLFATDTLLHGDFCLPNIMLDGWRHSGYIDLGCGGVGDRHVDLFWGAWTLKFNLGTDELADTFFDAYGRDRFDPEMIALISAAEAFG